MEDDRGKGTLPRLVRRRYQGHAVILWTLTFEGRTTGWLNEIVHLRFRELILHASARERVWCPVYTLMPDHMHLVWMGMKRRSDQINAMRFVRRRLASRMGSHRFQQQAHDHVLREHERRRGAFGAICFYVLANPVRANLVERMEDWPYSGAMVPGYPDLNPCGPGYWELFWRLHATAREPEAVLSIVAS